MKSWCASAWLAGGLAHQEGTRALPASWLASILQHTCHSVACLLSCLAHVHVARTPEFATWMTHHEMT